MPSESKLRVLEEAENLFMEKGYEVVKLRDIANALGIKQPSLYYHFPGGKEEIYSAVINRALDRLATTLQEHIQHSEPAITPKLRAIGKWAVNELGMSPTVMFRQDLPQLSKDNQREIAQKSYLTFFQPIIGVIENAIARGEIRDIDATVTTGMLVSIMEGVNQSAHWQTNPKMEMWDQSIDVLLNGMLIEDE